MAKTMGHGATMRKMSPNKIPVILVPLLESDRHTPVGKESLLARCTGNCKCKPGSASNLL